MKNKFWLISAILIALIYLGCTGSSGSSKEEVKFSKDASYALGLNDGTNIRGWMEKEELAIDFNEYLKGIKDGFSGKNQRFSIEEAQEVFRTANAAANEERKLVSIKKETAFMEENSKKSGVTVTESGLQYEIINQGSGQRPTAEDKVLINFEVRFINGEVYNSSANQGEPQILNLSQVIAGWKEGILLMNVDSKHTLYIPSALAFGEEGLVEPWSQQVHIRPNTPLVIDVELLEINPAGAEE